MYDSMTRSKPSVYEIRTIKLYMVNKSAEIILGKFEMVNGRITNPGDQISPGLVLLLESRSRAGHAGKFSYQGVYFRWESSPLPGRE